jgi:hypothetical protein
MHVSCPVDAKMAVCAMLALSAFVPVGIVAKNTKSPQWDHVVSAQYDLPHVLPSVELAGGTIISESIYTPIGREGQPRPPFYRP